MEKTVSPLQKRKNQKKLAKIPQLNLTSMIDVFTILLLFLLKSYSDVGINVSPDLKLPTAAISKQPLPTVRVAITKNEILVDQQQVVALNQIDDAFLISPLLQTLDMKREDILAEHLDGGFEGKITIEADKKTPYQFLKRVIYTCGQAQFTELALVVLQDSEIKNE